MTVLRTMIIALVLTLAACASDTKNLVTTAATTPLGDLNIVKADIPAILEAAERQPYLAPADQSCTAIVLEIHQLDEVLGADLDTHPSNVNPSLIERGAETVKSTAIGSLQHSAEEVVPFRGWVRKLSGAERYSRHVSAAIAAGSIRRAFLKGVGVSRGCSWVAQDVASVKPGQSQ